MSDVNEQAPSRPLDFERLEEGQMQARAKAVFERSNKRRTVRHFSQESLPLDVVRQCIHAAGTAPSGAHKQPWHFCLVTYPKLKQQIRQAAEKEEYLNYHGRMNAQWMSDLEPFGTDHIKPHLEEAPALIAVFRQTWQSDPHAPKGKSQNYYVQESVGIACGILIAALHECGIATLTHTPSPMDFLAKILDRPSSERAFLLLPIGYPKKDCQVPDIQRKRLEEICSEMHP